MGSRIFYEQKNLRNAQIDVRFLDFRFQILDNKDPLGIDLLRGSFHKFNFMI